ncbi:hypothetical protein BKA82DRAFT_2415453 [Pisolithus tinctorius]|nr:hypothetical protein BKA82DRAFT_2415453 [Pisolithus tinctorius]
MCVIGSGYSFSSLELFLYLLIVCSCSGEALHVVPSQHCSSLRTIILRYFPLKDVLGWQAHRYGPPPPKHCASRTWRLAMHKSRYRHSTAVFNDNFLFSLFH